MYGHNATRSHDDSGAPPRRTLRRVVLVLMAVGLICAVWLVPLPEQIRLMLAAAGASMALVAVVMFIRMYGLGRSRRGAGPMTSQALKNLIAQDPNAILATDEDGVIFARNRAAAQRFADSHDNTLAGTLRGLLANPSAALYRLQCRARLDGSACEDVMTRLGQVRIAVHGLDPGQYLWRIVSLPDQSPGGRMSDGLPVPMITVGRSGAVLFMNEAARGLVGGRVKTLEALFSSLPVQPGMPNSLMTDRGPVDVAVSETKGLVGRRELYFMPVPAADPGNHVAVFEALPVPMVKLAASGRILQANHLAAELMGGDLAPDTLLSDVMEGLGRPIGDWLRDTLARATTHNSEFLRLTRSDSEVFVQVTLSPVSEQGETKLMAVLNDATELKTLEAQFVQSQKMQAIGQLAGGVAHDFNNLLTAISGHCDLLLLRHDQGDQDYGDLVQINQNANRAAALVSQLLAFSRKQTLRPEVLDLRDILSDLTHLLNRLVGEKVTLTLSHDPVLRPVRADKRQLEQVMMNLVVNARDAMPQGGEIRINTEITVLREPLSRDRATIPAGEYVTVRVADDGSGIAPDKLVKVFEPFYTTKRTGEGTGLGLSTAYGIIKQSGGYIFVDSAMGQGTVFTLYFPVHVGLKEPVVVPSVLERNVAPKHGEGVVLLVEDEAPVRAFASRALRLRGYTVLEAESAEDALRTLEDKELSVDIFVTDVIMPGLDGPSWVREAMKERPNVRVVFVSGYAEGAFRDGGPVVPNSVFLPKPFSLNQLTDMVHQQLH